MESSAKTFEIALGLNSLGQVKSVNFDNGTLDIWLEFPRGHKFLSEGGEYYTAHDTVERTCNT